MFGQETTKKLTDSLERHVSTQRSAASIPGIQLATRGTPLSDSLIALTIGFVALLVIYWDVFRWLVGVWYDNADYSHGFFVPVFAAYILWSNRGVLQKQSTAVSTDSGLWIGVALVFSGLLIRSAGIYARIQTLEGVSMIPFILGILTLILGKQAIRWGTPAVLFLLFMVPLPSFLSGQMSGLLQKIATIVSTFSLQTLGIPAFSNGNIISLSTGEIGVAEACSGLRMLYAFFALTVGACMVMDRTWLEKSVIAVTAIPIAIVANCIRITATGVAFEFFEPETAQHFFHDVAGWLMMPLGFTILLSVLAILDRLIVPDESFPIQGSLR